MDSVDLEQLKIDVAAQDADVVAFYELRMKGATSAIGEDRAERLGDYTRSQLDTETRSIYKLSQQGVNSATARTIANIAGIQVGKDFFSG